MPLHTVSDPRDKDLGAYYTEGRVARALCRWAMRTPTGRLLDPAFGGGVFLECATEFGGGSGCWHLTGVELDREAHARAAEQIAGARTRLLNADFFSLGPQDLPRVDAVVGNPPFIRFQRFGGGARERARARASEAGLTLPPLAGSWVAFVAHATTFLAPGGRLAMVVPAELGHAPSARPLLDLLHRAFARVTFVTFRRSLFPHLDQETILLLADGHGEGGGSFRTLELAGPEALGARLDCSSGSEVDARAFLSGRATLAHSSLEPEALALYERLAGRSSVSRLGDLARVESGYVTGANSHFHLSPAEARARALPDEVLVPSVFRPRALAGLRFGAPEWRAAADAGHAGFLVQAAGHEADPAVARFLERLRGAGVDSRYKSRTRTPWYRIGRVFAPPLVLPAMGNGSLGLAVNEYGAAVPNTFHAVTPRAGRCGHGIAAAWRNSLTELSLELEGHRLGGGLLKLDPGEARQVLVPDPELLPAGSLDRLASLEEELGSPAVREAGDHALLAGALGLTADEIGLLRRATGALRAKRQRK